MAIAKVFMTGRSQAVRLPKEYRFDTDEVTIEKLPDGAVLLRQKPKLPLGERLRLVLEGLPDDPSFARPEQPTLERDAAWWDRNGFVPVAKVKSGREPPRSRIKAAVKPLPASKPR